MANSSDWIAALARDAAAMDGPPQGWMAGLDGSGGFVEGLALGEEVATQERHVEPVPTSEEAAPEPAPTPAPDPVAEAFSRGVTAGHAAAREEYEQQAERQRALRLSFRDFDQAAMDSLAGELAETVVALCSQAIEGFATDHEALLMRCSEAARRLGTASSECTLHLHPDDIALVDPAMLDAWNVMPDASVEQGGLRLEGADGSVSDGPHDWRRAIAAAIRG